MKKKIVFVGISGGVDSAVSAALLKEQGYDVVGVFIKTWHPDFLPCNEEEERRDAMRVAAHLDIPFLTFDFEEVYKKSVADYMIQEYKIGRTPNPDVMCNKEVKFGAFFERAISMGADFVAMGHYAQISTEVENTEVRPLEYPRSDLCILTSVLKKGLDPSKDQSYFLWNLKQEQLSKILFPIGNLKKNEVRKLAKKFNLPVAQKKDSQGLCFLGAIDIKEFLKHYIKSKKGKVLNEKGEIIGFH
ncbi:MAG: tRNA 2-thiouridine(34) synthase MnmA, partial [Patescibacteria group bacterium]